MSIFDPAWAETTAFWEETGQQRLLNERKGGTFGEAISQARMKQDPTVPSKVSRSCGIHRG